MAPLNEAAVAKRLAEIVGEFEQALEGEVMTPVRRSKLRRAAELTLLAEITRASALSGSATVAAVVGIEEASRQAQRELGIY